jgi:hypothetical protein
MPGTAMLPQLMLVHGERQMADLVKELIAEYRGSVYLDQTPMYPGRFVETHVKVAGQWMLIARELLLDPGVSPSHLKAPIDQ